MKRYIKTSTGATDIVRDLYHRMPNELDFIDERDRPDGRIDLIDQVISKLGDIIDELSAHDDEQSRDIRDYLTQVSENIEQYRSRNYE